MAKITFGDILFNLLLVALVFFFLPAVISIAVYWFLMFGYLLDVFGYVALNCQRSLQTFSCLLHARREVLFCRNQPWGAFFHVVDLSSQFVDPAHPSLPKASFLLILGIDLLENCTAVDLNIFWLRNCVPVLSKTFFLVHHRFKDCRLSRISQGEDEDEVFGNVFAEELHKSLENVFLLACYFVYRGLHHEADTVDWIKLLLECLDDLFHIYFSSFFVFSVFESWSIDDSVNLTVLTMIFDIVFWDVLSDRLGLSFVVLNYDLVSEVIVHFNLREVIDDGVQKGALSWSCLSNNHDILGV